MEMSKILPEMWLYLFKTNEATKDDIRPFHIFPPRKDEIWCRFTETATHPRRMKMNCLHSTTEKDMKGNKIHRTVRKSNNCN